MQRQTMSSNDVSLWLHMLDRNKRDQVSLFAGDYYRLTKLAPVPHERVIKNPEGKPRLFFVNRKQTIQILKELYAFQTKEDVTKEIKEALKDDFHTPTK